MVPKEKRSVFFVITLILGRVWLLLYIGMLRLTQDDTYWIWANFFAAFIQIIALHLVPESPEFYYAKGRYAESKDVFLTIAKFNGIDVKPE